MNTEKYTLPAYCYDNTKTKAELTKEITQILVYHFYIHR